MPDFATLKAQRGALSSRLNQIVAARTRLRQAEGEEAKILAAIGDLGKDEIDALREWARSGTGAKPEPNIEARRDLHASLVAAQTAAETARGVHADLDADEREIAGSLQSVNEQIEALAFDALQQEHRDAIAELQTMIDASIRSRVAHILGLRAVITGLAQLHQASGRGDMAMALFRRGEGIGNAVPMFDLDPTMADVENAAAAWRSRLHELTGDAPPIEQERPPAAALPDPGPAHTEVIPGSTEHRSAA